MPLTSSWIHSRSAPVLGLFQPGLSVVHAQSISDAFEVLRMVRSNQATVHISGTVVLFAPALARIEAA